MKNKKDIKDNSFLKMSVYFFNIFNESKDKDHIPAGVYQVKVNNRSTRIGCEICSKLRIKTPERRHWRCSGVFIVKFEHILHFSSVFTVNFEQVIADWDYCIDMVRCKSPSFSEQ